MLGQCGEGNQYRAAAVLRPDGEDKGDEVEGDNDREYNHGDRHRGIGSDSESVERRLSAKWDVKTVS